jgi:hypothetical protein
MNKNDDVLDNESIAQTGDPRFINHCLDFEELLNPAFVEKQTLSRMLKMAYKQSCRDEAKERYDITYGKFSDLEEDDESCAAYFGDFGEWLAWHFLNYYGHAFNIQSSIMLSAVGNTSEDYGTDGIGYTIKECQDRGTNRIFKKNAKVYIQVKTTLNPNKEYKPNDGSRLPNFGMNAMSDSIKTGSAYNARYLVFTTGKGLHFAMDKMSNNMMECIGYSKITRLMDRDTGFFNRLRLSVGLAPITLPDVVDSESPMISQGWAQDPNHDSIIAAELAARAAEILERDTETAALIADLEPN